jgi:hypothetical protein
VHDVSSCYQWWLFVSCGDNIGFSMSSKMESRSGVASMCERVFTRRFQSRSQQKHSVYIACQVSLLLFSFVHMNLSSAGPGSAF